MKTPSESSYDDQPGPNAFPRRRRVLFSIRRKTQALWYVFVAGFFVFSCTVLLLKVPLGRSAAPAKPAAQPAETAVPPATPLTPVVEVPPPVVAPVKPLPVAAAPAPAPARSTAAVSAPPPRPPKNYIDFLTDDRPFKVLVDANAKAKVGISSAGQVKELKIDFDFRRGQWVQIYQDTNVDLGKYKRMRFQFKGDGLGHFLELKLVDSAKEGFGTFWVDNKPGWISVQIPLANLISVNDGKKPFHDKKVRQIYFAVSREERAKKSAGRLTIRDIRFF